MISIILLFKSYIHDSNASNQTLIKKLISKIEEVEFDNSDKFMSSTYCYYIFQKIINASEITPKAFSKFIKGGSLSLKYAKEYRDWLKTSEGISCKENVGTSFTAFKVPKNKEYAIFLNKPAIIMEGKDINMTRNHERLHIAFAIYKKQQYKVQKKWDTLNEDKKKKFISEHPGYNFQKKKVLLKEFFSYSYQEDLEAGLTFLTSQQ